METHYNHNRELSDFKEQLDIIKNSGFNPIGVTQMYFEDTFIFKTKKEAKLACKTLEKCTPSKVIGWWYSKKNFMKEKELYESEEIKMLIYWL
jgi:hypothetical protein